MGPCPDLEAAHRAPVRTGIGTSMGRFEHTHYHPRHAQPSGGATHDSNTRQSQPQSRTGRSFRTADVRAFRPLPASRTRWSLAVPARWIWPTSCACWIDMVGRDACDYCVVGVHGASRWRRCWLRTAIRGAACGTTAHPADRQRISYGACTARRTRGSRLRSDGSAVPLRRTPPAGVLPVALEWKARRPLEGTRLRRRRRA